jgi:hypothetical protein
MMSIKATVTAVGATAFAVAMASGPAATTVGATGATAAQTNYLTFSGTVALPGVQLQAGTYIFERAIPDNADVVRVLSRDRRHAYLLAFTRQVTRPAGLRQGQAILLGESARGVPPPVRAWYPIDEGIGHEFIYPR